MQRGRARGETIEDATVVCIKLFVSTEKGSKHSRNRLIFTKKYVTSDTVSNLINMHEYVLNFYSTTEYSICLACICYRSFVSLSHGWICQKTVKVRIMKFSPYGSTIPLVFPN